MNLQGQRLIPAAPELTWAALNDPEILKACIKGCESLERVADNEYQATMAVRIGPVNARFKGRLELQNIVPISSYTLAFDGQGGVAGFGKGSADVRLTPEGGGTLLDYTAKAQVGGKLAQVGSRLIDGAASKIAEDFFAAFEARLAPAPVAAEAATDATPEFDVASSGGIREAVRPGRSEPAAATSELGGAADLSGAAAAPRDVRGDETATGTGAGGAAAGGNRWLPWTIGAAVLVIILLVLMLD